MSTQRRIFAPAKINLFLHVGDRGPDGYHALQSLVVFAGVGDWVEAQPATGRVSLQGTGPHADAAGPDQDNLVLKAAGLLREMFPESTQLLAGAALTLEKNLPVASGIGGGSSDAAAALLLLNRLWGLGQAPSDLEPLALKLGSDVPVCLRRQPQWMAGRGERLTPGPALPPFWLVLVNPGVAVATGSVFAVLQSRHGAEPVAAHSAFAHVGVLADWLAAVHNDLEAPARTLAPEVGSVLAALGGKPGCLLARMSGSGATCFGLFANLEAAQEAAAALERENPKWWVRVADHYDESGQSLKTHG